MSRPDRIEGRITIIAHPPERGWARQLAPAQAGASCCCCCCCLHSLGAVIGAAVAPAIGARRRALRTQEEEDYADFPEAAGRGHGPSAVRIFWLSVLILGSVVMAGGGVVALANGPGDVANGLLAAGFIIVMLLPVLLLLAAVVTVIVLGVSSRPDKAREFAQLGRIAAGALIGTLLGTAPMLCLFFVLTKREPAPMPDRRPRLALPFTVLTAPGTVRLVAGEDFRYTLTGPGLDAWLPAWLAGLDGRTPLADLVHRLPDFHRAAARELADRLYGERVLIDGTAADAHEPTRYQLAVEGEASWAADGWPAGEPAARLLPALCQDRLDYDAAIRFNRRNLESGSPFLWATTGPMARAYVGPLFSPAAGPCLGCLLTHFRRLSPAPDLYDALAAHAQVGGSVAPVPFPAAGAAIVRQLLLWKTDLAAEPDAHPALYRLHVLDAADLEVTTHRVFVDPECPACGGRN